MGFIFAHQATATVECIQSSLTEPSYEIPFIEPYLPYYDSIREEPEFVEFLAELDSQ